jgi:hypothetical protein
MKTLEELYQDLERYKDFRVGDNTEKFLETTDEIILRKDKGSIPILLSYFDDASDYDWVFVSLSGALEYYESDVFICEFLKGLPLLMEKAPCFARDFFNKIVFNEYCRDFLKDHLEISPKIDLINILASLENYYNSSSEENNRKIIGDIREKLKTMPDN